MWSRERSALNGLKDLGQGGQSFFSSLGNKQETHYDIMEKVEKKDCDFVFMRWWFWVSIISCIVGCEFEDWVMGGTVD